MTTPALCRPMNNVRHMSDLMQPVAFASGHLTGHVRSPWPLISFTSRGASFHLVNKGSMQPHTPSLWLRVHAMLVYFYPTQCACNEREAKRTQGSLSLFAMHVCSPPSTLAQFSSPFSSPLQICHHHQVFTIKCLCVSIFINIFQGISHSIHHATWS
jgi:hypothetical protein